MNPSARAYLIGWPVAHSLSPQMHEAAYRAIGLDWSYSLLAVKPAHLTRTLSDLAADPGAIGINVTIPHKRAVLSAAAAGDQLTAAVGAANTLVRSADGSLLAHNTDIAGFAGSLACLGPNYGRISRALLLGAGGSARACFAALRGMGVDRVGIVARRPEQGRQLLADLDSRLTCGSSADSGGSATVGRRPAEDLVWDWPALPEAIDWLGGGRAANAGRQGSGGGRTLSDQGPALVVNTTPLGMWPRTRSSPLSAADVRRLPRDSAVFDLIYRPRETLLIQRAQAAGLPTLSGAEMLVRQGAASLALWLGRDPGAPALEAMRQAVEAALAEEVSRDAASGNRR